MEEDDDNFTLTALNQRDLGATDSEFWQDESDTPDETCFKRPLDGWERSDICDFDDMSTSDGILGSVQAILSKRERESGIQYLVVWEDQAVDEARWVPQTSLLVAGATSHIDMFEAEEKLVAELMDDNDGDSENSEDSSASDSKMEEDERDNEDLLQRKIDRMADEQIARLLAKQEQLGMGSDELLLFDDDAEPDEDEDIYVPKSKPRQRASAKSAQRTEGKGAKRPRGGFPAAAALADAYDGFDVMDFERPSLKKKSKGRKGRLILDDVSDSELEESMQMAWENDRIKKKERKQEREELRSQGLLGKKGKVDMKGKYKEGMGVYAVKEEIKSFLMGHNESLSLPPMDKANRKIIHEIANAFKLKSKSVGNGNKRFPVLIRTTKTSIYVERTFAEVEAKLSRRFMPRMDARRSGGPSKRGGAGGGFGSTAVSYRDGDVVGGSAPELGVENKGRAMLEKMGWSSGTALGALNNKGILQPVSHIVKTSKAGLG
ncbi:r3h and g-patch domain-containing protein [Phlyctema vagabunda]|uniref:Protein SQS1 n=1 Tax=Phlyctema vagabunda TaxID=108571 RepID=A0ABR4PS38_9HELO